MPIHRVSHPVNLDLEPDEIGTLPETATSRPSSRLSAPRPGEPLSTVEVEDHLASLLSPRSYEADQYRVLRQFLAEARAARPLKMLAVTSPAAGDGKTTTSINLAATLAQTPGSRVLLVDTDLRRPFVAANLGLVATGPGLAEAAVDERLDLSDVVQSTPYNLSVLPAGVPPANPYQALESARVGQLLEQASAAYEYVVLDTPPVLLVPDCKLMSQWIDGFLLVVAAHRTPRKLLGEALSTLDEGKLLGIVFNGDDRPMSGYYGKYYGGYYHEQSAREPGGWRPSWKRDRKHRRQPWR
jgi:capsular exopolysaccharide synthesis family protein